MIMYLELQHPPMGHSYEKCSVNVFPHIKASICFIPIYFLWITIYKPWKETEEEKKRGGGRAVEVQGKTLFSCVFLNNKEEQRFLFFNKFSLLKPSFSINLYKILCTFWFVYICIHISI